MKSTLGEFQFCCLSYINSLLLTLILSLVLAENVSYEWSFEGLTGEAYVTSASIDAVCSAAVVLGGETGTRKFDAAHMVFVV